MPTARASLKKSTAVGVRRPASHVGDPRPTSHMPQRCSKTPGVPFADAARPRGVGRAVRSRLADNRVFLTEPRQRAVRWEWRFRHADVIFTGMARRAVAVAARVSGRQRGLTRAAVFLRHRARPLTLGRVDAGVARAPMPSTAQPDASPSLPHPMLETNPSPTPHV